MQRFISHPRFRLPDREKDLRDAALAVRENAHAPYSGFKVGAALRGASGIIYRGCNVENVAYPEGTCAEAGAIAAMVAAGETAFTQAYVVAGSPLPVTPCGGCRQKLAGDRCSCAHDCSRCMWQLAVCSGLICGEPLRQFHACCLRHP